MLAASKASSLPVPSNRRQQERVSPPDPLASPLAFKMSMFRAKKLDLGCFVNVKVIRDHTKRKVFEQNEAQRYAESPPSTTDANLPAIHVGGYVIKFLRLTFPSRQALRYIIRNLSLPPRMRAAAQLQLTQMHCYTRPTQIRNRCIEGGKGRGVLRDFRLSRVCLAVTFAHTILYRDILDNASLSVRQNHYIQSLADLGSFLVQLPHACTFWRHSWGKEGQLVVCCG